MERQTWRKILLGRRLQEGCPLLAQIGMLLSPFMRDPTRLQISVSCEGSDQASKLLFLTSIFALCMHAYINRGHPHQ